MTLDELVSAEKKAKSLQIPVALFVGFMFGIAVWMATHKGGFLWTIGVMVFGLYVGSRFSKNLKRIQAEISSRDFVG